MCVCWSASLGPTFIPGGDAFDDDRARLKKVHIRVQQRNGRKNITTVQGLDDDLDLKRIMKVRFAFTLASIGREF